MLTIQVPATMVIMMQDKEPVTPEGLEASETASFGYADIPAAEKPHRIRGVFDSVARRYDIMNDLMSGGIHRLWKSAMIARLAPRPGENILDVAGGTGDIAFRIYDRVGERTGGGITVCDLTEAMVQVGRARAIDRGIVAGIAWMVGDAEHLPFADRSFNAVTIAFGLRNVTHIDQALAEAQRVLKPGGRFLCLEFSHVAIPALRRLYDLYSFSLLPVMGQIVAQDRESYRYLAESIRRFPNQADLAARMTQAGLDHVTYRDLSGGIAALHQGWRI